MYVTHSKFIHTYMILEMMGKFEGDFIGQINATSSYNFFKNSNNSYSAFKFVF